jgi:hypothetical protein
VKAAMARKLRIKPSSTNILDYSCILSGFERESLAAEAKLKAELKAEQEKMKRKTKKR